MCKCTPNKRTPFCGKPGCGWPAGKSPEELPNVVHQIVGEIVAMEYDGDCKAIAAAIIDKDGDVRTLVAYDEGYKIQIMGGAAILQNQIFAEMRIFDKKRD